MLKKLILFFNKLSSKPRVGGLQITDSAVQYVLLQEKTARNFTLRLPPGVVSQGKIQNAEAFLGTLRSLHELIAPGKSRFSLKVIVVLPAEVVYTQSFNVPNVSEAVLEEASHLNLQAISPIASTQAYMASQVIEETQDYYQLLGAFVEKSLTDEYHNFLDQAGFEPVVFEFPALALARVVSQAIGEAKEPILVLQISSDGLDIFLFRNKSLHFDYFRSWQSIQGESREISNEVFEAVVVEEVQKVVNFALSRFKEVPKQALLVMPGLEVEIKAILEKKFNLAAVSLFLQDYPLQPAWYVALGAAIRGNLSLGHDHFIALGTGEGKFDVFYQEQILNFLKLWRNILAGVIGLFLVVFGISSFYLINKTRSLEAEAANISVTTSASDLQNLNSKAQEFNNLVSAVGEIKKASSPWLDFLRKITALAATNQITVDGLSVSSLTSPIQLAADAPDNNAVLRFKNVLVGQTDFKNVDLPLSNISTEPNNSVSFKITFTYVPSTQ